MQKKVTFEQVQQLEDPLVVAVRIKHASRDQDGVHVLEVFHGGNRAALRLNDKVHRCLDAERRVVVVPSLLEEFVENIPKTAMLLLRVWVVLIGFQDQHPHLVPQV